METENKLLSIRMRLAVSEWRTLRDRAAARNSTPAQYADLIFSYPLEEKFVADKRRSMDDPDEEIYVSLAVASTTRRQLEERSQKQQTGVATYAGLLVSSFLRRFEIDPRDLRMMRFLAERLDHSATLSEADLIEAVKHVDTNASVRLPPGYFAKWLYGRLQPHVRSVESDGKRTALTLHLLDGLLNRPG